MSPCYCRRPRRRTRCPHCLRLSHTASPFARFLKVFASGSGLLSSFRAVPANMMGGMVNRSIGAETIFNRNAIINDIINSTVAVSVGYPMGSSLRSMSTPEIVQRTVTKLGTSVTNLTRQGLHQAVTAPPLGNSDKEE